MSEPANIYLDAPDPLSVLLGRLDLRAEVYVNADFCGTWAVDTAGSRRIPFHLIGAGSAWLHFEGRAPRLLAPRQLVVFPHDAHHVISSSEVRPAPEAVNAPMSNDGAVTHMVCGFFEFKNPAVFPLLDAMPDAVIVAADTLTSVGGFAGLVELLLAELAAKRLGSYAAVDQIAVLLFIHVLREQVDSGSLQEGLLPALFDSRIGRALNAIHQRPEQAWDVDTLAAEALMSRSGFAARFRAKVGLTPLKYLASWRMTQARQLLINTSLSTAQIASRSGYESEAAFRKAFKHILGETPGAVRTAARVGPAEAPP